MQTMGAFEAKTHFSHLLEVVEAGEQVIITKHGYPVAKMIPFGQVTEQSQIQAAIKRIEALSQEHTLGGLDWKALRDEGKKS